jgi:hypothetical protein
VSKEPATTDDVHAAMPHPVVGSAADPIAPEPAGLVIVAGCGHTGADNSWVQGSSGTGYQLTAA